MKKMAINENSKRRMADSSDDDSSDKEAPELAAMEVDTTNMSKSIGKKKKVWSRA